MSFTVSGPEYFGFAHPSIAKLIQDMRNANKCVKYHFQEFVPSNYVSDNDDSVMNDDDDSDTSLCEESNKENSIAQRKKATRSSSVSSNASSTTTTTTATSRKRKTRKNTRKPDDEEDFEETRARKSKRNSRPTKKPKVESASSSTESDSADTRTPSHMSVPEEHDMYACNLLTFLSTGKSNEMANSTTSTNTNTNIKDETNHCIASHYTPIDNNNNNTTPNNHINIKMDVDHCTATTQNTLHLLPDLNTLPQLSLLQPLKVQDKQMSLTIGTANNNLINDADSIKTESSVTIVSTNELTRKELQDAKTSYKTFLEQFQNMHVYFLKTSPHFASDHLEGLSLCDIEQLENNLSCALKALRDYKTNLKE